MVGGGRREYYKNGSGFSWNRVNASFLSLHRIFGCVVMADV
jgi:hypothetical protein